MATTTNILASGKRAAVLGAATLGLAATLAQAPTVDLVRIWKDATYRATPTPAQIEALPANPASDLDDWESGDFAIGGPLQQYRLTVRRTDMRR